MSNKELYKHSFDKLCPSDMFEKEMQIMMDNQKHMGGKLPRRMLSLVAAVIVLTSLAVGASAAGLFENVRLWINGEEVDAGKYMDADGNITVEAEGEGRVDVLYIDGEVDGDAQVQFVPDMDAAYEQRNGRDFLVVTNQDTGEVQELEITEKMVNGMYQDTMEIFGCICDVELEAGDGTYSLSFSVEGFTEE